MKYNQSTDKKIKQFYDLSQAKSDKTHFKIIIEHFKIKVAKYETTITPNRERFTKRNTNELGQNYKAIIIVQSGVEFNAVHTYSSIKLLHCVLYWRSMSTSLVGVGHQLIITNQTLSFESCKKTCPLPF